MSVETSSIEFLPGILARPFDGREIAMLHERWMHEDAGTNQADMTPIAEFLLEKFGADVMEVARLFCGMPPTQNS